MTKREGEELELRESVKWFAQQMERKLRENDDRPGWLRDATDEQFLLARLSIEMTELQAAITEPPLYNQAPDDESIINEAADVANFAMMLADRARDRSSDDD